MYTTITDSISRAWSGLLSVTSVINFGVLLEMNSICLIQCEETHRPFIFVLAQDYTVILLSWYIFLYSLLQSRWSTASYFLVSDHVERELSKIRGVQTINPKCN